MNDGSGEYGRTGKSIYVEALKATIDEFIENNSGIDCNRIYIGEDSNGRFMTMRMIIDYPGFFAAAFPVCEALYDETISNADIENMANFQFSLMYFFVYASAALCSHGRKQESEKYRP